MNIKYCVTHCENSGFQVFSGTFGFLYELGQSDPLYTLWDHTISMKHPMRTVCVE